MLPTDPAVDRLTEWARLYAVPDDILEAFELQLAWHREARTGVFRVNYFKGGVRFFGEDGTRLPRTPRTGSASG